MLNKQYSYRSLIEAYIAAERNDYIHPDFTDFYKAQLAVLEKAFNIQLSIDGVHNIENRALWMLFQASVRSYSKITTPMASFSEAGLLVRRIDNLGEDGVLIHQNLEKIIQLASTNKVAHFELLDLLFKALFRPLNNILTSQDLMAFGFDDSTEPQMRDYDDYL